MARQRAPVSNSRVVTPVSRRLGPQFLEPTGRYCPYARYSRLRQEHAQAQRGSSAPRHGRQLILSRPHVAADATSGNAATFEWTLINHAPWDLPDYAKRVSDWPFFNDTIAWVDAHLNDELMQLQVKTLHHKTATLDVPITARVGDALAAYAGKFGVRKDAIRYVHQGRQLESKRTLASYGICAGDTVHTVTHLSGEMASGNGGGCGPVGRRAQPPFP